MEPQAKHSSYFSRHRKERMERQPSPSCWLLVSGRSRRWRRGCLLAARPALRPAASTGRHAHGACQQNRNDVSRYVHIHLPFRKQSQPKFVWARRPGDKLHPLAEEQWPFAVIRRGCDFLDFLRVPDPSVSRMGLLPFLQLPLLLSSGAQRRIPPAVAFEVPHPCVFQGWVFDARAPDFTLRMPRFEFLLLPFAVIEQAQRRVTLFSVSNTPAPPEAFRTRQCPEILRRHAAESIVCS